eukprot:TRINITY_DN5701_c0_g1_i1.p1 TRINITY_DN5701_c0_g1~~TRINITY_DN5701_c0_g1_i1.p1  ORF type:complete len:198 (-),score=15.61 TRINITY_DN5701_c0_g1_i1:54-647(-)
MMEVDEHHFQVKGIQKWELAHTSGSAPGARCWAGSCVIGSFLYIFGGYNGKRVNNSFLSDLFALNLETLEWKEIAAVGEAPTGRYAMSFTPVGKKIYCFGGAAEKNYFNTLHIFDTETCTWTLPHINSSSVPLPRCAHSAVRVGKNVYIFGGDHGMGRYLDDIYILNTENLDTERKVHPSSPNLLTRRSPLNTSYFI